MEQTTDVSVLLEKDPNGHELKRLLDRLAGMRSQLRGAQDKGLSAEDFATSSSLLTAVGAAERAVEAYWKKHQA